MAKQEEEIKPSQRYWLMLQCQFWIYHLFVLALSLYILVQINFINKASDQIFETDSYKYSLQAIDIWDRGYIIDIKIVNTDNCPQAYTPLINYTWPGTNAGCYCEAASDTYNFQFILEGDCSGDLIRYGCETIPAVSPKILKMWRGAKLICYKRVEFLDFYNSVLNTTADQTELKQCATGKQFQVHTLPSIQCPVSTVSNQSLTLGQKQLSLSTSESLFYQDSQNYPIADLKITEYQFCPFFNQTNISPNKNGNYILEVKNFTEVCNGIDPRIVQFDYLNQEEFITNNTRIYSLLQGLPGYPRPSPSYAYRLGYIRYPAWTYKCRTNETYDIHKAKQHLEFLHIQEHTKLLMYVGIPCIIVFAVFFRGFYIIRHIFDLKSKKQFNMLLMSDEDVVEQIPNLNLIKSSCKESMLMLVQVLLIGGTLVVFVFCMIAYFTESIWIKDILLLGCTETHLQNIFLMYEEYVDGHSFEIVKSILFCCLIIVAQFTHFGIRVFHGDLKGRQIIFEEQQASAEQLLINNLYHQDKELAMDKQSNLQLQDSSDVILMQKRTEKVYNLDNYMENDLQIINGDETNFNFYNGQQSIENQGINNIPKKKKKKKGVKRKNLFKDNQ